MEKAIRFAVEGGFKLREIHLEETAWGAEMAYPHILLDPLFWQALGKQQGWIEGIDKYTGDSVCEWRSNVHSFIAHIMDGKDVDSFFNNLLK